MTDPQPYTLKELPEVITRLVDAIEVEEESGEGGFDGAIADLPRLAATLREFRRVLAENEHLRADKERMDWLEEYLVHDFHDKETGEHNLRIHHDFGWVGGGLRLAIDAARSGGEGEG